MNTIALPQDLEGAHALILQLHARVHEMQGTIEDLRHRVDVMARRMFGRRSEQLSPDQMDLAFAALKAEDEAIEAAAAGVEPETDAADEVEREAPVRARKGHGRRRLSPDLVREERVLEPDSTLCPCCGLAMARIGEERSEQLDYVPSSLRVVETVRPTYACGRCKEGVISAPPPEAPVVRGKASAALMAHVAVSKYADHLPLNRQVGILARQGAQLTKQTLCGWIRQVHELLAPVEVAHWASVLASRVLQADETPVKLLDPPRPSCRTAYLWAYVGTQGEVAFDFSMGRGSDAPLRALEGFRGAVLQADAYAGYNAVERANPSLVRAGCMSHMRRKFYDARELDPDRALVTLARVQQLYEVEQDAAAAATTREQLIALRFSLRQQRSVGILQAMREDFEAWRHQVLPKGPIGKALGYALGQWIELTRYLDDGEIDIDNNAAERALRMVAVGRANWTFCGSEGGGQWAARLYGLLGTCRLQGVDPFAWLRDVLQRVRRHPPERMSELTPRGWKQVRETQSTDSS